MVRMFKFLIICVFTCETYALEAPPFDYELQEKLLSQKPPTCEEIMAKPEEQKMRSNANIRCVFDNNGAKLFGIFQKAVANNPSLEGQIIFDLVITSSGKVSSQTAISKSTFNDIKLEQQLLDVVRKFDFLPVLNTEDWHGKYPVTFYAN